MSDGSPGRTPPASVDAEMAVLGALLLADTGAALDLATELLAPADFFREAHGEIFAAMDELHRQGTPLDTITLKNALFRRGTLEQCGGIAYLMQLGEFVPTLAHLEHHARIVAEKAHARRLIAATARVAALAYAGELDARALSERAESEILEATQSGGAALPGARDTGWCKLGTLLSDLAEEVDTRYHAGTGAIVGVPTGLVDLDFNTGGLREGNLYVIAARPAMGKTAAVGTIGLNLAKAGANVAFFSLEMDREQLAARWAAAESHVDLMRYQDGQLSVEEWERFNCALQSLWDLPLYVDDRSGLTMAEVRSRARRLHRQLAPSGGLRVIVLDYLQRCRPEPGSERQDRRIQIDLAIQAAKSLARELRVAVIVLSQLSRAPEKREDKRPLLSDLYESGAIEAEADLVAFLYRPEYYAPRTGPAGPTLEEAEIIVAKHRQGPTGIIPVGFFGTYCQFVNLDRKHTAS